MKKTKITLALAATALLAACSVSTAISAEEVSKRLNEYGDHVTAADFKMPSKLTQKTVESAEFKISSTTYDDEGNPTSESSTSKNSAEVEAAIDRDAKYLYMSMKSTGEENGEKGNETMYSWLFADNGKYYQATASDDTTYADGQYVELPEAAFNATFDQYVSQMGAEALSETYKSLAEQFLSAVNSEQEPEGDVDTDASIDSRQEEKSFLTSGDGNLSVSYKSTVVTVTSEELEAGTVQVEVTTKSEINFEIDKYLPKVIEMNGYTGNESSYLDMKLRTTYDWGECAISKPDLTKFGHVA